MPKAFPISNGMSLITEALKRAERERESRTRRVPTAQTITTLLDEEEKVVESFLEKPKVERQEIRTLPEVQKVEMANSPDFELSETLKVSLLAGLVILSFLALYFIPRWPLLARDISKVLHFLSGTKIYHATSALTVIHPLVTDGREEKSATNISRKSILSAPTSSEAVQPAAVSALSRASMMSPIPKVILQPVKQLAAIPYALSGISVSGKDHYAIINNRIVQKGDSIDGAFVKEIGEQEAVLETRDGEIKLKLPN